MAEQTSSGQAHHSFRDLGACYLRLQTLSGNAEGRLLPPHRLSSLQHSSGRQHDITVAITVINLDQSAQLFLV